jgi:hypothetical protein
MRTADFPTWMRGIVIFLILSLAINLLIFFPWLISSMLLGEFSKWLFRWQTLVAALVASVAAYIAFQNTTRTLKHSERLENNRRNRKHAAVRAVLPLALAQVTAYGERSARDLNELVNKCNGESLPSKTAPASIAEPLPSETLETLSEFIEYSDSVNVEIIEATVAWIQIHDSRIRGLFYDNHDPSGDHVVVRTEIEGRIIDAASIYAGASAVFDYARRRQSQLPRTLSWDAVRRALRNMRFWDGDHPRLYAILEKREIKTVGPFERLTATDT